MCRLKSLTRLACVLLLILPVALAQNDNSSPNCNLPPKEAFGPQWAGGTYAAGKSCSTVLAYYRALDATQRTKYYTEIREKLPWTADGDIQFPVERVPIDNPTQTRTFGGITFTRVFSYYPSQPPVRGSSWVQSVRNDNPFPVFVDYSDSTEKKGDGGYIALAPQETRSDGQNRFECSEGCNSMNYPAAQIHVKVLSEHSSTEASKPKVLNFQYHSHTLQTGSDPAGPTYSDTPAAPPQTTTPSQNNPDPCRNKPRPCAGAAK